MFICTLEISEIACKPIHINAHACIADMRYMHIFMSIQNICILYIIICLYLVNFCFYLSEHIHIRLLLILSFIIEFLLYFSNFFYVELYMNESEFLLYAESGTSNLYNQFGYWVFGYPSLCIRNGSRHLSGSDFRIQT